MIANYHTHTPRCMHATGTEEEYVRCAIAAGYQILGFADHTPYPFTNGYVSHFRMSVAQLEDYVRTVRQLAQKYASQIQIHLGVEAEYYPKFFPQMVDLLREQGVEYMILGQHMVGNEWNEPYSGHPTADVHLLERYCNQSIEAMYTGLFTYFAHPDLIYFTGEKKDYRQQMRRLCQAANDCRIPVELNLLGIDGNRHYPTPAFWEVVAEENCRVLMGVDAHQPQALQDKALQQRGWEFLQSYGLTPMETVELRPIR